MAQIPQRQIAPAIDRPEADAVLVRNESGVDIALGQLVYLSGREGDLMMTVALADADTALTIAGKLWVAGQAIPNERNGLVLPWLHLTGVDTSGATAGDPIYASATAGGWTLTAPTAVSRRVGQVVSVDATDGSVLLDPSGGAAALAAANEPVIEVTSSGAPLPAGRIVRVAGYANGRVVVTAADADDTDGLGTATLGLLYVVDNDIDVSGDGLAVRTKVLTGVDTSGSAVGAPVYLSSTAGGWTLTPPGPPGPTAPSYARQVGVVAVVDASDGVVVLEPGQHPRLRREPVRVLMPVFGPWGIDVCSTDDFTNGGGLVGGNESHALLTAKVEDGGVFADLDSTSAEAGYTADYQLFPDAPVAETDYLYIGSSLPFCLIGFDMDTVATYDAAGVLEWFFSNGSGWAAANVVHDNTNGSTKDGTLSFARDGVVTIIPDPDWAPTSIDGVTRYWLRVGIAAGKAANLTQVPTMNGPGPAEAAAGAGAWQALFDGTITEVRAVNGAGTLNSNDAIEFMLFNFSTGDYAQATMTSGLRATLTTDLSLYVEVGETLGVVVTQEDGTNEPSNVMLELTISPDP